MADTISEKLVQFVKAREGWSTNAYREKHDVVTIGYGFTNLDKTCQAFFKAKWGRPLRLGDTITKGEGDVLLGQVLRQEYLPPVLKRFGRSLTQERLDCCVSVSYNCGAGTLSDRWADALAAGDVKRAAELLKETRVTAQGHPLAGLRARRALEADLLLYGRYGSTAVAPAVSSHAEDVEAYQQQLKILGFYKGEIDGVAGPGTIDAVKAYQAAHPDLVVDGVVGRATRACLERDVRARNVPAAAGSVVAGGAIVGAIVAGDKGSQLAPSVGVLAGIMVALVVAVVVGLVWRSRHELARVSRG